jgi:hypothetical protein
MGNSFYIASNLNSIDWSVISTLIIALCSLWVSISTARKSEKHNRETLQMTMEHNKKSVRPIISESYVLNQLENFEKNYYCTYDLKNCGFGPAIVNFFKFRIDGKEYFHILEIYYKYIDKTGNSLVDPISGANAITQGVESNAAIAPNETVNLFKLVFKDAKYFNEFQELAKKIQLIFVYEDIYGEERRIERNSIENPLIPNNNPTTRLGKF